MEGPQGGLTSEPVVNKKAFVATELCCSLKYTIIIRGRENCMDIL